MAFLNLLGTLIINPNQLYEELCFNPPRAFVLCLAALRQKRIDFINENHSRLVTPKKNEINTRTQFKIWTLTSQRRRAPWPFSLRLPPTWRWATRRWCWRRSTWTVKRCTFRSAFCQCREGRTAGCPSEGHAVLRKCPDEATATPQFPKKASN